MDPNLFEPHQSNWRRRLYIIIFEAETPPGKLFDILLIASILASVLVVMLDSVRSVQQMHGAFLYRGEWTFTILFTIEYFLRLISHGRPVRYANSFFGIIDLLAIIPTYLSAFFPGSQYLLVIRLLRILRIFRVFKLVQYIKEASRLIQALRASRRKITVFLFTVLILVTVFGSIMYVIEGEANGFSSIPQSIYWAIVTLTTVGYGDLSPKTDLGQAIAAIIMILGYSIIAVPTGIVTVEMSKVASRDIVAQTCPSCNASGHDSDAHYCKYCGMKLHIPI